ncbi:hypothetical protein ACIPSJ_49450 [Streptomyces sp. NPDC090088]|uniref:hypothetical protein n=1 Tax=Streptomyces sp. NPDC090088 TaxID=3365944 RepID=UPI00382B8074
MADAPPRPYTNGETQAPVTGSIDEVFAPQLTGLDAFARERIHARLHRTVGNPAAKSALDMTLWDIAGQAIGKPVSELLHRPHARVPHARLRHPRAGGCGSRVSYDFVLDPIL